MSLAEALAAEIDQGATTPERRRRIHDWALRSIDPEVVATYLLDIIAHLRGVGARPIPPWRSAPI